MTQQRVLETKTARVFAPFLQHARYKGARGGRGSGKSHDRAEAMLKDHVKFPGLRSVCLREVQKSIQRSSKQLLEDKISKLKLRAYFDIRNTEIRAPGDGVIIFQGMQDHTAESIKSLEGFHRGWYEEAQSMSQRSLDLLRPTFREDPIYDGGGLVMPGSELWFTWNTRFPTDPIDEFFFGGDSPPNSIIVRANYYDNPWFPKVLRDEMEWDKIRNPEKYAHVWLGGYLHRSEARVFNNWRVEEFETPADAVFLHGGDWGFSVDPSVLIRCFVEGRTLYIDREVYRVKCEIDKLPALFDGLDPSQKGSARRWPIRADSARPDTISYMRRHGYPKIIAAKKGPGSIEDGIEFLLGYDIVVHPRCIHTIDELTYYSYKVDKFTDQVLSVLEDKNNNVIDSLRYAVEHVRMKVQGPSSAEELEVAGSYDGQTSGSAGLVVTNEIVDPHDDLGVADYDGGLM